MQEVEITSCKETEQDTWEYVDKIEKHVGPLMVVFKYWRSKKNMKLVNQKILYALSESYCVQCKFLLETSPFFKIFRFRFILCLNNENYYLNVITCILTFSPTHISTKLKQCYLKSLIKQLLIMQKICLAPYFK